MAVAAAIPVLANLARVGMAGVAAIIASQQARKAASAMQSVSFGPGNVIDSPAQVQGNEFGQTQLPMPRQKTFADYVIENPFLILGTNTRVMNNPATPRINQNETLARDNVRVNPVINSESGNPAERFLADDQLKSAELHLKQQIAQRYKLENQIPRLAKQLENEGFSVRLTEKGEDTRIGGLEITKDGELVEFEELTRSGTSLVDIVNELDRLDQIILNLGANKSMKAKEASMTEADANGKKDKVEIVKKPDDVLYFKLSDKEYADLKNEYEQTIEGVSDGTRDVGGVIKGRFTKKGFVNWLTSDEAIRGDYEPEYLSLVDKARKLITVNKGQ